MPAQTLTWGLNSYGNFGDANQWVPREAPTPGISQTLNVIGGGLNIDAVSLNDYTINLTPGASYVYLGLTNQVIDAETVLRQAATSATIYNYGNVSNFGEMQFGATGVPNSTNLTLNQGAVFRNTGTVEVLGTLVVDGPGYFVNNGTLSVDGGVAVIGYLTYEQVRSSFIVENGGTLQFNGQTNGTISFADGSDGRVLFDQPGAANSVAAVKGFDRGDEIVIQGGVASANYLGDGASGTLFLLNDVGSEVGRIPFSGNYKTSDFAFAPAAAGKTSITSTVEPPQPPRPGPDPFVTSRPVLDLDDYGIRASAVTVNGANDATIALPNLTVRGTALSRADFLDGSLVFDSTAPNGRYVPDEDASAVARMYYTVLGRAPEFAGTKYWVGVMDAQDYSIQTLAPSFYTSPEFRARYGENTTDSQFVDLLYRNILGRGGEAAGTTYWEGQLGGGLPRDVVVASFSESVEHQANRYNVIERNGIVFADAPLL